MVFDRRVRVRAQVTKTRGTCSCDCSLFKFEGTCEHTLLIDHEMRKFSHGKSDFREHETLIAWDYSPMSSIAVSSTYEDPIMYGVVSPKLGDLSLYQLAILFSGDILMISTRESVLNVRKLYKQCEFASEHKSLLDDESVTRVGSDLPKGTDPFSDSESDFEELSPEALPASASALLDTVRDAVSTEIPAFKVVKRPHPSQFFVDKDTWEQIAYSIQYDENILLVGPSGSGKTQVLYHAANLCSKHLEAFNMGAMSEPRTSLIGNVNLNTDGTHVSDSRFVETFRGDKGPAVILLDELTRAVAGAFNILLPALDDQHYLALDEHEEATVVTIGPGVMFAATANVGMEYTGTEALDKALKDRFGTVIEVFFPPADNEISIIMGRCPGINRAFATKLVRIAETQRQETRASGEFNEFISTRMLLAAGRKIARGMKLELACVGSILNHFSGEGGDESDRTKIQQIIQKHSS